MSKPFKYTIYKQKDSNNLCIRMLGKRMSTGIADSLEGRRIVAKIAEHKYQEFLQNKGFFIKRVKTIGIKEIADDYLPRINQKKTRYILTYSLTQIDYEDNYPLNKDNIYKKIRILLRNKVCSATTLNTIITKLQTFFNRLYDDEIIKEKIELKKFKTRESKEEKFPYTEIEVENIFRLAKKKDKEFYLLLAFLRFTGFRIGETLQLTKNSFDWINRVIYVPNKVNKSVIQKFPITKIVEQIYLQLDEFNINNTKNQERLFRWSCSTISRLRKWLEDIETELNIKKTRRAFHGFRRSFSDAMFSSELGLDVIKDLMRHSSINTTMDLYKSYQHKSLADKLEKTQVQYEI